MGVINVYSKNSVWYTCHHMNICMLGFVGNHSSVVVEREAVIVHNVSKILLSFKCLPIFSSSQTDVKGKLEY